MRRTPRAQPGTRWACALAGHCSRGAGLGPSCVPGQPTSALPGLFGRQSGSEAELCHPLPLAPIHSASHESLSRRHRPPSGGGGGEGGSGAVSPALERARWSPWGPVPPGRRGAALPRLYPGSHPHAGAGRPGHPLFLEVWPHPLAAQLLLSPRPSWPHSERLRWWCPLFRVAGPSVASGLVLGTTERSDGHLGECRRQGQAWHLISLCPCCVA